MKNNYFYLYELDKDNIELEQDKQIVIEVFREGKWKHPIYGWIKGDTALFQDFIKNWKDNVLGRDIIFDKNHKPQDGGTGIVRDLFIEGDRLKAKVELTNFGLDLVKNKGFRYFSPEFTSKYTDKEKPLQNYNNVLIGGALTLRPFLTNLAPVVLSEDIEKETKNYCLGTETDEEENSNILTESFDQALDQMAIEGKTDINKLIDSLSI